MTDTMETADLIDRAKDGDYGACYELAKMARLRFNGDTRLDADMIKWLEKAYIFCGEDFNPDLSEDGLYDRIVDIVENVTFGIQCIRIQASYILGMNHFKKEEVAAIGCLKFAADNGHAEAALKLSEIYCNGLLNIPPNRELADRYWDQAVNIRSQELAGTPPMGESYAPPAPPTLPPVALAPPPAMATPNLEQQIAASYTPGDGYRCTAFRAIMGNQWKMCR